MELKMIMSMLRKWLWFVLGFVLVCTAGMWYFSSYVQQPIYEASTTMLVNKSITDHDGNSSLDINQINSNIMLINSYKVILGSASVIDKFVEKNPHLSVTSEEIRERIDIVTLQNSQIIVLKIQDPSYEQAMQIVNGISEVFKSEIPKIMKVDNISILDSAKPQHNVLPVSPRIWLNVAVAFAASLLVALGIVFVKELLDDTIKSEDDVERYLELTLLGTVGRIKKRDLRLRARLRSQKKAGEKYASVSN
ncbi:protein-tyrosine kinase activator TkmA [Paenibacillus sp. JCM 10914]|uniref:YveK family protein n=1 Tax=Paenibacillus sp. JCM 10914 TaxID=1236974 RepID=UPI0003CC4DF9|nr:Wzz/FepE/Etk N-terminal domain-containing protein [Paenibacillus sp. JCM 10914]GAE07313.1 hypothetical protein JCM10914_3536 [Paenibacillus sp. JCM 10914]